MRYSDPEVWKGGERIMKKKSLKLKLSRETLRRLDEGRTVSPNQSCAESCYFVSCGGGCGISEGATTGK
jgi:hypothetical protein